MRNCLDCRRENVGLRARLSACPSGSSDSLCSPLLLSLPLSLPLSLLCSPMPPSPLLSSPLLSSQSPEPGQTCWAELLCTLSAVGLPAAQCCPIHPSTTAETCSTYSRGVFLQAAVELFMFMFLPHPIWILSFYYCIDHCHFIVWLHNSFFIESSTLKYSSTSFPKYLKLVNAFLPMQEQNHLCLVWSVTMCAMGCF